MHKKELFELLAFNLPLYMRLEAVEVNIGNEVVRVEADDSETTNSTQGDDMGSYQSSAVNGQTTVVETVGDKIYINGIEANTGKLMPKYKAAVIACVFVFACLGFLAGQLFGG